MDADKQKKDLEIKGEKYQTLTDSNLVNVQASGATDSSNISEHVFAAKIFKSGGINGRKN